MAVAESLTCFKAYDVRGKLEINNITVSVIFLKMKFRY